MRKGKGPGQVSRKKGVARRRRVRRRGVARDRRPGKGEGPGL